MYQIYYIYNVFILKLVQKIGLKLNYNYYNSINLNQFYTNFIPNRHLHIWYKNFLPSLLLIKFIYYINNKKYS